LLIVQFLQNRSGRGIALTGAADYQAPSCTSGRHTNRRRILPPLTKVSASYPASVGRLWKPIDVVNADIADSRAANADKRGSSKESQPYPCESASYPRNPRSVLPIAAASWRG
jgi:hypothetical protein